MASLPSEKVGDWHFGCFTSFGGSSPNKVDKTLLLLQRESGTWPTMTAWTLTHEEPQRHPRRTPMPSPRPMAQATWGRPAPYARALRLPQFPPAVSSTDPRGSQHAHVLTVWGRVGHEGGDACGMGCDGGGGRPWGAWNTSAACKYCQTHPRS